MNRLMILAALSATALIAGSASASDDLAPAQYTVSTRTVNFDKHAEVAGLYAKLKSFAVMACDSGQSDPISSSADKACTRQTLKDAVHQVGRVELSRLDQGQSGVEAKPIMTLTRNDR